MTDEEIFQLNTVNDLFLELSANSRKTAVGLLRLLLVEEHHPF